MAWVTSEEGKRFMRLSGERWCEAHIASGDDEAEARAMAERTIAAYTGAPGEPSGLSTRGSSVPLGDHVADVGAVDGQGAQDHRDDPHGHADVEGPVRHRQLVGQDPGGAFPDHRGPRPAR